MSHNVQHQIAAIMRRRGGFSFGTALRLLEPYSPRLAYNFIDPTNSLFQGNTLTPVTTVTNPIGVVIDQTQGGLGSPGANLTNPLDFTEVGWSTIGALSSVSALSFTNVSGATAGRANTSILQPRKWYKIDVTFTQTSAVNFSIRVSGSLAQTIVSSSATSGTLSGIGYSGDTDELYFRLAGNSTLTITSISVREIPGYHATASSDAKRPLFARYPATGRRNLLMYTEEFSNAAWTKQTATVSGTIITPTGGGSAYDNRIYQLFNAVAGTTYTISVRAKGTGKITIAFHNLAGQVFDLTSEYQTFTLTYANLTTVPRAVNVYAGDVTFSTGAVTSSNAIDVLWVQAETGATATAYQKVVTSADITEAGVRDVYAALFDGADDCLQVSGFDLSNTDEVCVIAGVRKVASVGGMIVEHTANSSTTNGSFRFFDGTTSGTVGDFVTWHSRGTTTSTLQAALAVSSTAHIVGVSDISGDVAKIVVNGTSASVSADQGTGNYANSTLNIGQRNNATLPYNGYVHYLFICGAIVPDEILTRIYRGLAPQIGVSI